jgi:hypothetical protein
VLRPGARAVLRQHDHFGADLHAGVKILDVLVGQADAAGRNALANRRRIIGAVDAILSAAAGGFGYRFRLPPADNKFSGEGTRLIAGGSAANHIENENRAGVRAGRQCIARTKWGPGELII